MGEQLVLLGVSILGIGSGLFAFKQIKLERRVEQLESVLQVFMHATMHHVNELKEERVNVHD